MRKHDVETKLTVVIGLLNDQREILKDQRESFEAAKKNIKELGKEAQRLIEYIAKKTDGDDEYPNSIPSAIEECGFDPLIEDDDIEDAFLDDEDDLDELDIKETVGEIMDYVENA